MKAVIQAGGLGTRLKPYTMILPKPLMPIGNQPVLELLLKWLRRNGTRDAYITTGHLGHLIGAVCGDGNVIGFREKPSLYHTVSMGIYCMEPEIIDYIPRGVAFGFDDLMFCLLGKNVDVHCYVHEGLWLDIGRVEDFQAAQETDFEKYSPALRLSAA